MKISVWMLVASVSIAFAPGCDEKGGKGETEAKVEERKPPPALLSKKLADVTEDDMKAAATALGWGDKPSATHSKGLNETIIVSGNEEHPDGTESPDGKKRIRMSIGLYIEPDAAKAAAQKTSLEGRGQVAIVDGNRVLTASYNTKAGAQKAEAQKILDQLVGS